MIRVSLIFAFLLAFCCLVPYSSGIARELELENYNYCASIGGSLGNAGNPGSGGNSGIIGNSGIGGNLKKGSIYRFHLSGEIMKKCAPGCSDLRITGSDGVEVPYVILKDLKPEDINPEDYSVTPYSLTVTHYNSSDGNFTIILKMPEMPVGDKPINTIFIRTADKDFNRNVVIEGSRDTSSWQLIKKDTIYDFTSQVPLRKTDITFGKVTYNYYRLSFFETSSGVRPKEPVEPSFTLKYKGMDFIVNPHDNRNLKIDGITAQYARKEGDTGELSQIGETAGLSKLGETTEQKDSRNFTVVQGKPDAGNTTVDVDGGFPIKKVFFDVSNPYYWRDVSVYYSDGGPYVFLGRDYIYLFPPSAGNIFKNNINLDTANHAAYRFVVENGNNPPLEIKLLRFAWVRRYVYFVAMADSANYSVCVSGKPSGAAGYEISAFINQGNWYKQSFETLKAGDLTANRLYVPPQKRSTHMRIEKAALSAILVLLVALVGYRLYKLVKEAKPNGSGGTGNGRTGNDA